MRRSSLDIFLACFFLAPFRCRVCWMRFFRFRQIPLRKPAARTVDPPRAPLLMMPRQFHAFDPLEPRSLESDTAGPVVVDLSLVDPPHHQTEPFPWREPTSFPAQPARVPGPQSILILGNDLSIRNLIRRLLDRRGYRTHEVIGVENLPAQLRERHVDLLIVDLPLSGANGMDAALAVARQHPALKVLVLSLESQAGDKVPAGCFALMKPFSLEWFLESVDRLLELPILPDND